jgi:hypothetical protein
LPDEYDYQQCIEQKNIYRKEGMTEGQPHNRKPEFGKPLKQSTKSAGFFTAGEDLPLFSGTPQQVIDEPFVPVAAEYIQTTIPDMPAIDYDVVREKDRQLRRHRARRNAVTGNRTIFPQE